jgi:hypothetical protein
MKRTEKDLPELRRNLKNAKRRALFWSGRPSYSSRTPRSPTSSKLWEKYELAMCDIKSLCGLIEDITGKPEPSYDPKREFQKQFSTLLTTPTTNTKEKYR